MPKSPLNDKPIDAVITWVDGEDPKHQEKLGAYLRSIGGERPVTAHPTRFHNAGEIEYCIVSLLRFAPWIRTIFIVTDGQTPHFISSLHGTAYEHRVKIVDHKTIFKGFEAHLPTFNIRSIMTVLWRIPELADQFIFLNDDFVIIQPVLPKDFFCGNKIVVRGKWKLLSKYRPTKRLRAWWRMLFPLKQSQLRKLRAKHLLAQEFSATLAGMNTFYLQLQHNPHPWKKSTMDAYFQAHPERMLTNIQEKLRSSTQFISEALATYLEVKQGNAKIDNTLRTLQIKPKGKGAVTLKLKLWLAEHQNRYAFACIQSIERGSKEEQEHLFKWLNRRVGKLDSLLAQELGTK